MQMPRRGVHFASYACLSSDAKALRSDEDPFQGGGGLEGDVGCSIGERSEKLSVSRLKNGMELRKHGKAFVISNTVLTDVHNRWALQHFRFSMTCKGLEWSYSFPFGHDVVQTVCSNAFEFNQVSFCFPCFALIIHSY